VMLRRIVYTNPEDGVTYAYLTTDFTLPAHSRQLKQEIAISLSARRVLRSDFTCLGSGS
jgi:hypothetical protein